MKALPHSVSMSRAGYMGQSRAQQSARHRGMVSVGLSSPWTCPACLYFPGSLTFSQRFSQLYSSVCEIILVRLSLPWQIVCSSTTEARTLLLPAVDAPEYSLETLKLELKLQCFGHLMQRADSLEKTLMLGKTEGRSRRG